MRDLAWRTAQAKSLSDAVMRLFEDKLSSPWNPKGCNCRGVLRGDWTQYAKEPSRMPRQLQPLKYHKLPISSSKSFVTVTSNVMACSPGYDSGFEMHRLPNYLKKSW